MIEISLQNYVEGLVKSTKKTNLSVPNGDLLKPFLVERQVDTPTHHEVQDFLVSHFSKLGWTMERDNFIDSTPFGKKNFTNYIFTKNPKAKNRIVLAAHYDSKYFEDSEFIGATDSAAPCAMLLDIAEALNDDLDQQLNLLKFVSFDDIQNFGKEDKKVEESKMAKKNYRRADTTTSSSSSQEEEEERLKNMTTLQLIFFDGEEAFSNWTDTDSTYGARHLANKWKNEKVKVSSGDGKTVTEKNMLETIKVFVLLDLLGAPRPLFNNYYVQTEDYFNALAQAESLVQNHLSSASSSTQRFSYFKKSHGRINTNRLFIDDDHKPFLKQNVPILHLIPYPFPSVWHKPDDSADALDEATIADLTLIIKIFVAEQLKLNYKLKE